jgi:NAD(P)-dependent dehydrogenase (short-subunit alcohol dehydrogenase family)
MNCRIGLVTGGNRGIGLEICRQLAERGIKVILTARSLPAGEAATAELQAQGLDVIFHQLDVTDGDSVAQLAHTLDQDGGRLDILVNNAGIYIDRGISPLEVELDLLRRTMETNVYGPLSLSQMVIPLMRRNRYGRIVNISSQMASLTDMGGRALAYRTSKTALNAVTRILANEVQSDNILVNAVDPGWVRSDMGGKAASRSLAEGADTATWLATLPDDGPTGGYFRDRQARPW